MWPSPPSRPSRPSPASSLQPPVAPPRLLTKPQLGPARCSRTAPPPGSRSAAGKSLPPPPLVPCSACGNGRALLQWGIGRGGGNQQKVREEGWEGRQGGRARGWGQKQGRGQEAMEGGDAAGGGRMANGAFTRFLHLFGAACQGNQRA